MATKLTGPGWFFTIADNTYEPDYYPQWIFLPAGESVEVEIKDGYYFTKDYWDTKMRFTIDEQNFKKTNPIPDGLNAYKTYLEDGYLSTADDCFTIKLPPDWGTLNFDEESGSYGSIFGLDKLGVDWDFFQVTWYKLRLLVNGVYYRVNIQGSLVKDENQTATRSPLFSTDTTTVSVSIKSHKDGRNSSKSINYINKNASNDSLVNFTDKLNALSNNTPLQTIKTSKRNLLQSVTKRDSGFDANLVYGEVMDNFYLDEANENQLTVSYGAGDNPEALYLFKIYKGNKVEGYNFYGYLEYGVQAELGAKYADIGLDWEVSEIIDVATGRPPTWQFIHFNPYGGGNDQTPEGNESDPLLRDPDFESIYAEEYYSPEGVKGREAAFHLRFGDLGVNPVGEAIEQNVDITFTFKGNAFYKPASVTKRLKIIQAVVYR